MKSKNLITKMNEFYGDHENEEISPIILKDFKHQLERMKLDEYLKTIIGFYPITTIQCFMNKYEICFWRKASDIFIEEPVYHETFTMETLEPTLNYVKGFMKSKSINDLLSNFSEMGKKKF